MNDESSFAQKSSAEDHVPGHHPVVDPENASELVRLLNQERLLSRQRGGLLPEHLSTASFHNVLDVACGPGGWALDLAFQSEISVTGIDISKLMISYANTLAEAQLLDDADFLLMDATEPLRFPDASFDLVNAAFLAECMPKRTWPFFLQECWRILCPGGIIRLTEDMVGVSSSPAYTHFQHLYRMAMHAADYLFLDEGERLKMKMLESFVGQIGGFTRLDGRVYTINYSRDTEMHEQWCQNLLIRAHNQLPFLVRMGVSTLPELKELAVHMREEMYRSNFSAFWCYETAWGTKATDAA